MPRLKKPLISITGDNKDKKMILALDPEKHAWIKSIADATDMPQPKVVNMIVAEASKMHVEDYINQINKMSAKDKLADLEEKAKAIDIERKRLKDLLDK